MENMDQLLKQKDVEKILGASASTLEQWRLKGLGPRWCRLGGRSIRYKMSAIQEYIDNLKSFKSTTEADTGRS